jgi:hypothetical protein
MDVHSHSQNESEHTPDRRRRPRYAKLSTLRCEFHDDETVSFVVEMSYCALICGMGIRVWVRARFMASDSERVDSHLPQKFRVGVGGDLDDSVGVCVCERS